MSKSNKYKSFSAKVPVFRKGNITITVHVLEKHSDIGQKAIEDVENELRIQLLSAKMQGMEYGEVKAK